MKFYKHVVWDWNGTLLDDARLSLDVFNSIAAEYALPPVDFETYTDEFSFPVINFYKKHGFDFEKIDFRVIGNKFIDKYLALLPQCAPHAEIPSILADFRRLGFTQSVLSANNDTLLKRAVAQFGLDEFFVRVDGLSDIYANSKTELAQAHIAALGEMGISPEQTIMAGDTLHDEDAADAMNVDCAIIARGYNSAKQLSNARRAKVFSTHAEFFNFAATLGDFPAQPPHC